MSLRRLTSTRHPSSGRVTTDMSEAARILFCWHFCWHSHVEDFQILAAHAVQIGGEGRNRTDECSFCRAVPYHLATPPEAGLSYLFPDHAQGLDFCVQNPRVEFSRFGCWQRHSPGHPNKSSCGGGASFCSLSRSARWRAACRTLPSGVSSDSSRLRKISRARSSTGLGTPASRATWMP